MGVVLAFAAAAALFVGATSVPAVGDEAELVDAPVISDTEIINDTPAAGDVDDTPAPIVVDDTPTPIVVDDITEDDISPEVDPLDPEGLEALDEFGELEAGLGLDLGLAPMGAGPDGAGLVPPLRLLDGDR